MSDSIQDRVRGVMISPSFWGAVFLGVSQILIAAGSGHLDFGVILTAIGIVGAQAAGHSDGGK